MKKRLDEIMYCGCVAVNVALAAALAIMAIMIVIE